MQVLSFLDSGVGGLAYYHECIRQYRNVDIAYVADTQYFPYGNYDVDFLKARIVELSHKIVQTCKSDIHVLACNTASVSSLASVREKVKIPIIGVVPAIRMAQKTGKKRIYMMSTTITRQNDYTWNLINKYGSEMAVFLRGFPELVESVEHMVLQQSEEIQSSIKAQLEKAVEEMRDLNVDCVILACTHFLFILEQLKALLPAEVQLSHSLHGVVRQIGRLLQIHADSTAKEPEPDRTPQRSIYITDKKRKTEFLEYAAKAKLEFQGVLG